MKKKKKQKQVSDDIEYIEIDLDGEPDKSDSDEYFYNDAEDEEDSSEDEAFKEKSYAKDEDAFDGWEGLADLKEEDISVDVREVREIFLEDEDDSKNDDFEDEDDSEEDDFEDEDDLEEDDFEDEDDLEEDDFEDEDDLEDDDLENAGEFEELEYLNEEDDLNDVDGFEELEYLNEEDDFEEDDFVDKYDRYLNDDDMEEDDLDEDDSEDGLDEDDSEDEDVDDENLENEELENEEGIVGGKKETKAERKSPKSKRGKIAAIVAGSILGVLLAAYIGVAVYFGSHFMFNTTINGIDCSTKDVAQVEEYMEGQVADYVLTLAELDGTSEEITGDAISLEYVPGDELKELVKKQNNFLWPATLWEKTKIEASVGVQYDAEALAGQVGALNCLVPENQTPSIDAHPEFQETEFVVVPEVIGTQIDTEKFQAAITTAINGFQHSINLLEEDCYIMPRFSEDSEEVINAKDAMNSYLGACITYDFSPNTEVVDSSAISQWVTVDADMNVTFNQEAVRAYVTALAEKYDTINKVREFTTANGNVVSVEPGTYGWEIDQETEYATLTANIQNAEVVTREPAYFNTAATHDTMDMGNSYAEVDLSAQYMWLFQDGQAVFQAPVVTGNPNIGNRATPSGVYSILEMLSPTVLVGERDPSTGQPEYRTPVTYWMRVTWSGIGFHDATWQSAFGGDLYLSVGSHGCINMSYGDAQTLYSMIYVGLPVVIHY